MQDGVPPVGSRAHQGPSDGWARHVVPASVPTRLSRVCAQRGLSSSRGHPNSVARVTLWRMDPGRAHAREGWGWARPSLSPGGGPLRPSLPLCALSCHPGAASRLPQAPFLVTHVCAGPGLHLCACLHPTSQRARTAGSEPQV